jgi:hypothetical protein
VKAGRTLPARCRDGSEGRQDLAGAFDRDLRGQEQPHRWGLAGASRVAGASEAVFFDQGQGSGYAPARVQSRLQGTCCLAGFFDQGAGQRVCPGPGAIAPAGHLLPCRCRALAASVETFQTLAGPSHPHLQRNRHYRLIPARCARRTGHSVPIKSGSWPSLIPGF